MSVTKDLAIRYTAGRGPGFVVWECPEKIEYQTLRDDQPSPGPGWVKVWPVEKASEGENDEG